MAYYHYQCRYCGTTTYSYDDGIDDGVCQTSCDDDCGCGDQARANQEEEDYFDDE